MKHHSKPPKIPSESEYQRFAEEFTDLILKPRSEKWIIEYILQGGFTFAKIPNEESIVSGGFAQDVLSRKHDLWVQPSSLVIALYGRDRKSVALWVKENASAAKLSREGMRQFLTMAHPTFFPKSLRQLEASTLKIHRGPEPQLPVSEYSKLLTKANMLRPAMIEFLTRCHATNGSIFEVADSLQEDFPEAGQFLQSHIIRLHQALNDRKLNKRAEKRVPARARVLADAMAGAEYGLSLRTSLERVGEARRTEKRLRSPTTPSADDFPA